MKTWMKSNLILRTLAKKISSIHSQVKKYYLNKIKKIINLHSIVTSQQLKSLINKEETMINLREKVSHLCRPSTS